MRWPNMRRSRRLCKLIGNVSAGAAVFVPNLGRACYDERVHTY